MSPFSQHIEKLQELQGYLGTLISEIKDYRCPDCEFGVHGRYREGATAKAGFTGGHSEEGKQDQTQKQSKKNDKKDKKKTSGDVVDVDKYDTLQRDCVSLKEQNQNLSSYISDLEKNVEDKNSCISNLEKTVEEKSSCISDLEKIIEEKISCISDLEKTIGEKVSCISDLEKTIEDKENQIYDLRKTIKDFNDKEERRQREISEKDKEIEKSKLKYQNVTDKCETLKQQVEDHLYKEKERQEKISKLNQYNQQLSIEKNNTEKNYTSIQREKSRMEKEQREQKRTMEEKDRELHRLRVSIREKEELITSAEKNESKIRERCRWLEQEVERISKAEIAVGFHTTLAPTMSSLVLEGLTSRLTDRLAVEKVDLVRQAYSGNTDYCWPLLVVCVNVSRIGADAKEALKGIPKGSNKDVALLVFHHKEAHALPSQTSDKILTGSDFNHLGTIIDLAFLSQKGIYECEMNTVGIERVVSFLLQYKTQKK
ncbi:uncharacterized protein LOC111130943 isoform X1 [Crassostrea virginica]